MFDFYGNIVVEKMDLKWMENLWIKKLLIRTYVSFCELEDIEDEIEEDRDYYTELFDSSSSDLDATIENIYYTKPSVVRLISNLS